MSIKMIDTEHSASGSINESTGLCSKADNFEKIGSINESTGLCSKADNVEKIGSINESTGLCSKADNVEKIGTINESTGLCSKADNFEKIGSINESTGLCSKADNVEKIGSINESTGLCSKADNVEKIGSINESTGLCNKADNFEKIEIAKVVNDGVESRHVKNQSVVHGQGTKHTNSFPDSPISLTESSDSSDLPSKRNARRKKKWAPRKMKRVKKVCNDNIYEVEYILDYIEFEEDAFYLVKWKGWESTYNSWEPKENVNNCMHISDEFFSSVYGNFVHSRETLESFGWSLVKPTKETIEELMLSLVADGVVQYQVPSLRKVCMALSSLLSLPEAERRSDTVESVKRDIMLRCLHVKRTRQLKSLKEWEDEINASSNTAADITVENTVDLEGPPENFFYVNDYIPGSGVSIPDEPPIGCNCTVCSAETCSCVKEGGTQFAYCPNGTIKISSRFPIYECNKLCKCSDNCVNRVVQKGCRVKLSIFRTSNGCGWGVKALESIPKGSFLCEYVGEVINAEEAEERGQKYDTVGQTYLFDLDFNDKDHCPYTVDAAVYGNISHFFNHSCSPNLTVYAVWINCLDPDLPKLAFFAKKPIHANQEITFDYHAQTVIPRASTSNIICKCKSTNCRKYLF